MRIRRARRRKVEDDGAAILALIILVVFFLHCVAVASIWAIGSLISVARGRRGDIAAFRWPSPSLPPPETAPERTPSTHEVGKQFEEECAQLLRRRGWRVQRIGGSSDKGGDLIGRKSGIVLVVQCKCYGQAAGTRAVQEAHTAGTYYRANIVVAVAKNGFTIPARNIARRVGVRLLSVSDLGKI